MMTGRADTRWYAWSAYTAVAFLILCVFYNLNNSGLFLNVTYNTTQPLLSSNVTQSMHQMAKGAQNGATITPSPEAIVSDQPQFEIKDKVAVIIESGSLSSLTPLLTHFSSLLGPSWPIVLFTMPGTQIPTSPSFRRLVQSRRLAVRYLRINLLFDNRQAVSNFLTERWLYDQLAPAKHMLLFHSDSMLCARSEHTVDDFLQYDFVGAPIAAQYGQGFNGGLSLRNRTMVLEIIKQKELEEKQKEEEEAELAAFRKLVNQTTIAEEKPAPQTWFEDQFFYTKMSAIEHARLPSQAIAQEFAVETIWYDRPMGYHQVQRWQPERIKEVDAWCPEHRLVNGG